MFNDEKRNQQPPSPLTFTLDNRSKSRKVVDGVHGGSNLITYAFLIVSIGLSCIIGLCFVVGAIKYIFTSKHGMLALFVVGIPCGLFLYGFIYSLCTGNCFDPSEKVFEVMGEDGTVETYRDVDIMVDGKQRRLKDVLEENPHYLDIIDV